MTLGRCRPFLDLVFLLLLSCLLPSPGQSASKVPFHGVGVDYGQLGNNLPSPETSVELIRSLRASAVKIYDANQTILRALCGSGLVVAVMVPNDLLPSLAANQSAADAWVADNILPFYSTLRLRYLLVGNEILSDFASNSSLWPYLVPSMLRLHQSLRSQSLTRIKVSTTHAMDVLQSSFPPSAGRFRSDIASPIISPMLDFLRRTSSFFFLDAYPYLAWSQNPNSISLDYALFQGNASLNYHDPASGLTYTNLLDQMLDAVAAAMVAEGFPDVRLALTETGWPNAGDLDQIGANVHNAAIYNRNLVRRVAEQRGLRTPARPAAAMPVFIFSLYNENQKPGPGTERHWGLLYPNGTAVYEIDLRGRRPASDYPPLPPATNNQPYTGKLWCVVDGAGGVNETALAAALTFTCGQGNGTCEAIGIGGACFEPNTVTAHANYAFNSYWQQFRSTGGTCYFGGLAVQTTHDPSK
ncbi:putative glucan endo-1,3-beta-glucosidase A6 [Apostasia shenzhenica]|uniref:glucan endo-1,3-beta-D-glucosidase n=1 Tax=Apostasia shenzhenica TaxID=1088818 RepID=A0A2I0AZE7_9ASPA|nr:putative glucan endo-1,3-beta-glucosidase A6 [Apostasia shenzhenica]